MFDYRYTWQELAAEKQRRYQQEAWVGRLLLSRWSARLAARLSAWAEWLELRQGPNAMLQERI